MSIDKKHKRAVILQYGLFIAAIAMFVTALFLPNKGMLLWPGEGLYPRLLCVVAATCVYFGIKLRTRAKIIKAQVID